MTQAIRNYIEGLKTLANDIEHTHRKREDCGRSLRELARGMADILDRGTADHPMAMISPGELVAIREGIEACLRWPYLNFDEHVKEIPGKRIEDESRQSQEAYDHRYLDDVRLAQTARHTVRRLLAACERRRGAATRGVAPGADRS